MMEGQNQHTMFERIRLGYEGAYNFFINNLGHPAGGAYSDMDDRLLDAVNDIGDNLKLEMNKVIYRLNREQK
jgi:hypothetical protein